LSAGHRHENCPGADFFPEEKREGEGMKTLSVLFTIALVLGANRLAAQLKRANALPLERRQPLPAPAPAASAIYVAPHGGQH